MRDLHRPGRSDVVAANGMCATSHPLAAKVAVQMLEAGGNAVDAAIAGALLLGLCEPQMTGIGGDCFALVSIPNGGGEGAIASLNGSGRAPAGLSADGLRARGHTEMPAGGADAVTIPGAIDAFCALSDRFGRLGLAASLAPAIHYAEAGVPVAERTAFDWALAVDTLSGAARARFLIDGRAPRVGQMFRAPAQAEVLRRVAAEGRAGFYEGPVAQDMIATLQAAGGCHVADDFATARCDWTTPIHGAYRGTDLIEHPANAQGPTALLIAAILGHFDVAAMDPHGAARIHLDAEAAKLAYDARDRFVADPDHASRMDHMLAADTAAALAGLIDPRRAMPSAHAASEAIHRDTVYITVVDRDRMAVSLIYSLFHSFGAGIASERFGVLFQNRGAGFSLEAGHPNEAGGGKRPMHTIIPAMLRRDGRVTMPFGVMGGAYQPAGHARVASNMIDFGMGPQAAIDAPRSFPDPATGLLRVERGYDDRVHAELAAMGHRTEVPDVPLGGAQAIVIDDDLGVLIGGSDARKDGCALGY